MPRLWVRSLVWVHARGKPAVSNVSRTSLFLSLSPAPLSFKIHKNVFSIKGGIRSKSQNSSQPLTHTHANTGCLSLPSRPSSEGLPFGSSGWKALAVLGLTEPGLKERIWSGGVSARFVELG